MPGRTLPQQLDEMSDGNGVHGGGSWRQAGGPESTPEDLSLGVSRGGEEGGRPPAWRSHDTGLRGSAPSPGKRNDPVTLGGRPEMSLRAHLEVASRSCRTRTQAVCTVNAKAVTPARPRKGSFTVSLFKRITTSYVCIKEGTRAHYRKSRKHRSS